MVGFTSSAGKGKSKRKVENSMYLVYVLVSKASLQSSGRIRSYLGCTNDFKRRLRQHNGEITGGAKYTRKLRPWVPVLTVSGFQNKSEALQFEWASRHVGGRKRRAPGQGVRGRLKNIRRVLARERWTSNSPLASRIPLQIQWYLLEERPKDDEWGDETKFDPLPTNVSEVFLLKDDSDEDTGSKTQNRLNHRRRAAR